MLQVCKPNFVSRISEMAIIYLVLILLSESSDLPGTIKANNFALYINIQRVLYMTLLQVGFTLIPINRDSKNGPLLLLTKR